MTLSFTEPYLRGVNSQNQTLTSTQVQQVAGEDDDDDHDDLSTSESVPSSPIQQQNQVQNQDIPHFIGEST